MESAVDALDQWGSQQSASFPRIVSGIYSGTAMLNRLLSRQGRRLGAIVTAGHEDYLKLERGSLDSHPSGHAGRDRRRETMWARLTRIPGLAPERIDDAVSMFEDQELPLLEQSEGFEGITVMVDPALGTVAAMSLWDTQQHMRDSEKHAREARDQGVERAGAGTGPQRDLVVEHLEVKLQR